MEDNNNYNEVNDDYEIKDAPWHNRRGQNDFTPDFDPNDIEKNKIIAGLSYLGILFFLPLLACPDSKFGRFHANQSFVLFMISLISWIIFGVIKVIFGMIPLFGLLISIFIVLIQFAVSIVLFALYIIGAVNAFTGKAKELPLIGTIKIIK